MFVVRISVLNDHYFRPTRFLLLFVVWCCNFWWTNKDEWKWKLSRWTLVNSCTTCAAARRGTTVFLRRIPPWAAQRAPVGVDNGASWSEERLRDQRREWLAEYSGQNTSTFGFSLLHFVFHLATGHPEELEVMGLTTLETRRLRGNFIETLRVWVSEDYQRNWRHWCKKISLSGSICRDYRLVWGH